MAVLCGTAFLAGCHRAAPGSPGGRAVSFTQDLADAKQAGMPGTAQALQRPLPPPEQNAAPLYSRLTDRVKSQPLGKEDEIAELLVSHSMPSTQQYERARRTMKHRSDLLALIHQAAVRPGCVFVRDWSRPSYVPMPELSTMRRAARLLNAESLLLAHDGKARDAVRNQALGFQVARHATADNGILPYLTSYGADSITLNGLQKLLYISGTDPAVAESVRIAVEHDWSAPSLSKALQFEAGSDMVMLEYLRTKGPVSLAEVSGDPAQPTLRMNPREWSAFIDVNGSLLLKQFRRLVAVADLPYPQALPVFQTVQAESEQDKDRMHLLTLLFFGDYTPILDKRANLQATVAITRAAVAALVWKEKHGSFPSRLETALSPVPPDPFDGKPIRYRLEGKGFVIYSVGPTGKFAGGLPDADKPPVRELLFRFPLPSYFKGPIKELY